MAMKKGLGRGLDALFESYREETVQKDEGNDKVNELRITEIDPNPEQPRKQFDDEKMKELVDSIRIHGVVQPIIVVPKGKRYVIVAGERRWRACREAAMTIPPGYDRMRSRPWRSALLKTCRERI